LPEQVQAKAYVRINRLAQLGNNLKRPESDFLRDGIYELRWRFVKVQYRILYFFSGERLVVLSHLITKQKEVPNEEIERSIVNKRLFESNPDKYTYCD
jgi:phage-related protein